MERMFKSFVFVLFVVLVASACGNSSRDGMQMKPEPNRLSRLDSVENMSDYLGCYEGVLPAADCPGIKTQLTLYKNNAYRLVSEYIDRQDAVFIDSGSYVVRDELIILREKDGDSIRYKIEKEKIILLKKDMSPVIGDLADHYVLKRVKAF